MNQTEICTINAISKVKDIKPLLETNHNGFPVLNTAGNLVGLIPMTMIVILLEEKSFYKKDEIVKKYKYSESEFLMSMKMK